MEPRPMLLRRVLETLEETLGFQPDPHHTMKQLGIDSLELANLEIDIETNVGIYTASTVNWIMPDDDSNTIALKLDPLLQDHQRKFGGS